MLKQNRKQSGFTIVELLIVIVVIAILAAISIVAYTGIQNRANDTTVQTDLRNFASKIMEYHAINGSYPTGHVAIGGGSGFGPIQGVESFPFSRGSYHTAVGPEERHNIYYCEGHGEFAVGATSKSGERYYFSSEGGLSTYTGSWTNAETICPGMLGLGSTSGITQSYAFRSNDEGTWSDMAE